jgi:hypothetical protein
MVQRPILPKWFWKAVLGLLLLLLLLFLLWWFLLRPTIESAAEDAASEAAAAAADQAVNDALAGPIADQQVEIDDLREQGNDLAERLGGETVEPRERTAPRDIRLTAAAGPGGSNTSAVSFETGETFELTDILLQNPDGNVGRLAIRRGGDTLLVVALENFRDLDYHFVVPVVFAEGESLVLQVICDEVTAPGATSCDVAAYFSGSLTAPTPTDSSS